MRLNASKWRMKPAARSEAAAIWDADLAQSESGAAATVFAAVAPEYLAAC